MEKETEKEFVRIRTEFQTHKTELDKKLDNFMIEIRNIVKPPFSVKELILYFIAFLAVYGSAIAYIITIDNKSDSTREKVDGQQIENKEYRKETSEKIDKILEIVGESKIDIAQTKTDIAFLKGITAKSLPQKERLKEQLEKNKQIVRDFASN